MNRRQFAFWVGMFLFWLGEKARASVMDTVAAAVMRWNESVRNDSGQQERWKADENTKWRWYVRESLIDDEWKTSGVTTPIHKETGQPIENHRDYLSEELVPKSVKLATIGLRKKLSLGEADVQRRAAGGRPPSKWLRSLDADELRYWLKTIQVPEAGVEGMTYWTHLTRDHSFAPERIRGLSEPEQAKLHGAAHHGY